MSNEWNILNQGILKNQMKDLRDVDRICTGNHRVKIVPLTRFKPMVYYVRIHIPGAACTDRGDGLHMFGEMVYTLCGYSTNILVTKINLPLIFFRLCSQCNWLAIKSFSYLILTTFKGYSSIA